eukprot:TRINITY_DN3081_c0_g2_i1.p1 TRINITY_DN3081_c0_g2~~TRINITY_DN3081_c0_g2_i1.p1  ORF type:complete len:323 (+),score=110.50 TRINITY_DN3081_c0_g2_i1:74-970(+)
MADGWTKTAAPVPGDAPAQPPPAAAAPVQAVPAQPLMTLRMDGLPLPKPFPPVTDLTPKEQYEQQQAASAERARSHSRTAQETRAAETTGFFGKAAAMAKAAGSQMQEAATKMHMGTEATLREKVAEQEQKSFVANFGAVAAGTTPPQQLICSYSAKGLHQGATVQGEVYLCSTHLCFAAEKPLIREAIPLPQIASLQPSVVLPTSASGCGFQGGCLEDGPPFIIPVPAPAVVPTCVQVFTVDGRIVQFLKFDNKKTAVAASLTDSVTGNAFGRFYNDLDHAWRKATPVPVPGVRYVE